MRVCAHFLVYTISKDTAKIRDVIYNAYTSLYKTGEINFQARSQEILEGIKYTKKNKGTFRAYFEAAQTRKKLTKTLLTLHMYLKYPAQPVGVCSKPEIEHIFPKQWKSNYFDDNKKAEKEVNTLVESIGNKIFLEKSLISKLAMDILTLKRKSTQSLNS
nr:DUF1524 domain-containing protein [Helicobacter suis]